jgi:hypothetical protein
MINYTERITLLVDDVVQRVPALAYIDTSRVLVFARFGRSQADGAYATCHCLNLPPSEPGHYFWLDRRTGRTTRRSQWFVTKSPVVQVHGASIDYLISFTLPRFCDQTLDRSRKDHFYPGAEPWMAKLDTVVHELYHVDPHEPGIRRIHRADGTPSPNSHGRRFFETVAELVHEYMATNPDPRVYDFLRYDFAGLLTHHGSVTGTTFRPFPSFPQRYMEVLTRQPRRKVEEGVRIVPIAAPRRPTTYTAADLYVREFSARTSRALLAPRAQRSTPAVRDTAAARVR